MPLHGPNQWPREELLPGFRATVEAYFQALTALGHKLLRLLALSLQLPGEVYCRALQGLHPRMPEELQYGSTATHYIQYSTKVLGTFRSRVAVYSCLYEPHRQIQHFRLSLLGPASWRTTGRLAAGLLSPQPHTQHRMHARMHNHTLSADARR